MKKTLLFLVVFIGVCYASFDFVLAATTIRNVSNQGLIGWWAFDEATSTIAHDFSGNSYNGTLTNGAFWASGRRGQGVGFDGNDDVVAITNPANGALDFGATTDFTLSAWVKTSTLANTPFIIDKRRTFGGTNAGYTLQLTSAGLPSLRIADGVTLGVFGPSSGSYTDGAWHHYVVSAKRVGVTRFFVDGIEVSTADISAVGNINRAIDLYIGSKDLTASNTINGSIDDVRIYNRALSTLEATALYRAGEVVRKNVSNNGLAARWSFDEGTSTIAHDFAGNSYNGTLVNSPVWSTGKGGSAILFNGSSNYVIANNPVNFNSNYSVSFWVYLNTVGPYGLFANAPGNPPVTGASGNSNDIYVNPNGTVGYFVFDGVGKNLTSTTSLSAGRWYQVSVTHDVANSIRRLYINGRLEHQDSFLNIQSFGKVIFSFNRSDGGYYTTPLGFINGKMDDVRIYNRALSINEVNTLYTQGSLIVNRSQNNEITNGLVGMWSFNGVDMNWTSSSAGLAYDRSGNNNTGTLVGMTQSTSPVAGKVGQALYFDGADSVDIVLPSTSIAAISSQFTVSVWVNFADTGTFRNVLWQNINTDPNNAAFSIRRSNNDSVFVDSYLSGVRAQGPFELTPSIPGQWNNYTATYNGATQSLYKNGVLQGSSSVTGTVDAHDTKALRIGGGGGYGGILGSIDETRIYNRALSATEVKQLYLMGR